jgi:spermidine/putrescine transport system ATP-binding protein
MAKNGFSGPATGYAPSTGKADTPAVAELRGVTKTFGEVVAAEDLNIRIAPGEFLSFLGPSGCGKTTALRMLAGFEAPTRGQVLIDGEDVTGLEAFRRPVNMVFQSYALFPHLTVERNIAFGLRQRRPRPASAEIAEKVARTLNIVRLEGFEHRRIWEMSGGQQQRVALARAIVNEPKLLLLDEPLAALDRKLRKEMQIELQDLQRQIGITFVLVTHDQEEALSLSDRICVMRAGRIVQTGTPQELYDRPTTRYVADFVGTSNFFDGTVTAFDGAAATVRLDCGETLQGQAGAAISTGQPVSASLRPERIRLSRDGAGEGLPVTVQNRIFLGEHTEYLVCHETLGNINILSPRQSETNDAPFAKGDQARVSWDPASVLVLHRD